MRRGFASMLMGLSLLVASVGWAGLVFADNVLDEHRSDRLTAQLMDHDGVRGVLVDRLGEGMERYVPVDEPMSRQELRSVAAEALDDPAAAAVLHEALSEAHRLGLAGIEAEPTFDDFDVNEAARHALLSARPSLQGRILVNPLVRVRLPVEGLTWFSGLKTLVDRFAVLAVALAAIGFATSFVVAEDPTPVLHRGAWWILTSAAVWMAIGPAFAALVRFSVPSSYVVLAVAVESVLRAMRIPAIVMASFGIGLLSVGYLAPAMARRRGALLLDRARRRLGSPPDSGLSTAAVAADSTIASKTSSGSKAMTEDELVDGQADRGQLRSSPLASRVSAAWKEGHGYLDDARVAPFFSGSGRES